MQLGVSTPAARLSGSALKVIAMASMVIDHCGAFLLSEPPIVLFDFLGEAVTLSFLMRCVGRLAFPLFVFLLVEGFAHTRSRPQYALRLALFALISDIPWNLVNANSLFYGEQNVFFTLLLGLLALMVIERFRDEQPKMATCLVGLLLVSVALNADYGCVGFGLVLLMHELRGKPLMRAVLGTAMLGGNWLGGLAFYAIYPVHLFIIWTVACFA